MINANLTMQCSSRENVAERFFLVESLKLISPGIFIKGKVWLRVYCQAVSKVILRSNVAFVSLWISDTAIAFDESVPIGMVKS